jgi:hypothetical protein
VLSAPKFRKDCARYLGKPFPFPAGKEWERSASNQRLIAYQAIALPLSYAPLVLNCLVSVNGVTRGVTRGVTSDTLIIGSCFGKVKDGLPPPPYGLFRVFRVSENGYRQDSNLRCQRRPLYTRPTMPVSVRYTREVSDGKQWER